MKYPFEFSELLLTKTVLDVIGFTEYWSGCGDFGDRRLNLGELPAYLIWEIDELDDPCGGYCGQPVYESSHFSSKDWEPMYFLHEMYEDIVKKKNKRRSRKIS